MEQIPQSFNFVSHSFNCLQLISWIRPYDEELQKAAEILSKVWPRNSSDFVHQILSFQPCFKDIILIKSKTTK